MITPGDSHSFEIHSTTKFINIKFNDIYIHSAVFGTENIKRLNLSYSMPTTNLAVFYEIEQTNYS